MKATSVKTVMFLKVDEAMSWPARVTSETVMADASEESFSIMMVMLP
jgi:hypothetical protein